MKFFRFLTALFMFQLSWQVSSLVAQEITEFEIRKSSPSIPFPASVSIAPLDDNGHVLPSNQCKPYIEALTPTSRCGFSAGLEDDQVVVHSPESGHPGNQIDLSPLNFQCMDTGCEFEYASSVKQFRANLELLDSRRNGIAGVPADDLTREDARQVIDSVFEKATSVREIIELQFAEYEYVPYVAPEMSIGLEPATPQNEEAELTLSSPSEPEEPVAPQPRWLPSLQTIGVLAEFWMNEFRQSQPVTEPVEWVSGQLTELECRLCGTTVLSLYYGLSQSVDAAHDQLQNQKVVAEVQEKSLILNGFASVIRSMGESLISVSDSIVNISNKKVETLSSHLINNLR